ncbi:hypothetical protein CIPAW_01G274100 [Carya illinoinensis]|uniref:Uncharacterized protein n=1 Tax=Carya illinoinensis TaxID=32201 RepID=A0A8T1RRR0_CARIL|nr:hypothetical protein CIPAW_01G274100 [Carya illinoinensis]
MNQSQKRMRLRNFSKDCLISLGRTTHSDIKDRIYGGLKQVFELPLSTFYLEMQVW